MTPARAFLAVLGIVFLVAAIAVATVDRLVGIGFFVVGAFLLVLPFLAAHGEEGEE